MRVVVTGASGYLGRHVVEALEERGHDVFGVGRSQQSGPRSLRLDLSSSHAGSQVAQIIRKTDVVVHCAGLRKGQGLREGNGRLAHAAIELALHTDAGFVCNLSSAGVFRRSAGEPEIVDTSPLGPSGEYEQSKLDTELIIGSAAQRHGFQCVQLRPVALFGGAPERCFLRLRRLLQFPVVVLPSVMGFVNVVSVMDTASLVSEVIERPSLAQPSYLVADSFAVSDLIEAICASMSRPPRIFESPPSLMGWLARSLAAFRRCGVPIPIDPEEVMSLFEPHVYRSTWLDAEFAGWRRIGWRHALERCDG